MHPVKKILWPVYHSVFVIIRSLGLNKYPTRQNYLLGKLHPNKSLEELMKHLETQGFSPNFIAWSDKHETQSLRKVEGDWQYHLRVYQDLEIRGHYELTPEAGLIAHFLEMGMEERREEFLKFLEGYLDLESGKTKSQSRLATFIGSPFKGKW